MTTQFSQQQVREAILSAANKIEQNPGSYNFFRCYLQADDGCGCMLFHVGRELGINDEIDAQKAVAPLLLQGRRYNPFCADDSAGHFYQWCATHGFEKATSDRGDAATAAKALRAYANEFFAEQKRSLVPYSQCEWRERAMQKLKVVAETV